VATLGYVANWHRLTVDISYWDIFEQPSPLDHTWSLAIEEQFYVVWPLVALLGLGATSRLNRARRRAAGDTEDDDAFRSARRRRLGWVALGGAAVSFGLLAWQYSPISTDRAYFGTDSRIGATLLGAALAVFVAGGSRSTRTDRAANVRGIAAPAPGPAAEPIANGGTQVVVLPRVRLQRVEAPQSPLGWGREVVGWLGLAWLGWSVFTVDGLSSWYYQGGLAVFALATLAVIWAVTGAGADGPLARLLSFPPLRGLGLISYGVYLWHWPVDVYLNGDRLHVDRWLLDLTRLVVTFAVAVVSYRWLEQPIRHGALRGRTLWAATVGAGAVTLVAVLVATAGARPTTTQLGLGPVPFEGSDSPYLVYPEEIPPDATRLLAVGDSGVYHLGPVMAEEAEDHGFVVATSAPFQCTIINPEGLIRFPDGEVLESGSCQRQRRTVLRDLVREFRPDVVVYYLANVGGVGHVHIDGEWVLDCEATFDDYLTTALQQDADLLTAEGARLVLATSPYTVQFDDRNPERTVCRNDTYGRVAASRPDQVTTVDLNAYVLEQQRAGVPMFKDIVHLSTRGSRLVTDWLLPQLELLVADDRSTTTRSVRAEPSISG
jgi:peptidoglycan/LPS O-acetylase OafA/YrhL